MSEKKERGQKTTRHLVAGFSGGLTSALALQPLDLMKTRVQQSKDNSLMNVLKSITSVKQLWRGTLPSAIRTSVGSGLYLSTLHLARNNISKLKNSQAPIFNASSKLPKLKAYENIIIGMLSRSIVGFITMPITVIKIRFESNLYQYKSIKEAVIDIFKYNGINGFFRGFGATCLRDAPYAGLYISSYEQLKSILPKLMNLQKNFDHNNNNNNIQELGHLSSGIINSTSAMIASIFATTVTAPFDTIKTRMQLSPEEFTTFSQTSIKLYNENFMRFFDGLSLRLIRKAGSAAIAWCIYEELVKI
ncbi:Hem25 protein [Pichia kluyveri]|uniref:Mitochondrial glycine transporter n=1 Tax=Pichia kluyveri TaxID=36015 RepID=A0AAV5RAZ6_PICKL|nr:Hem25 protein [Pichia kluyveri]